MIPKERMINKMNSITDYWQLILTVARSFTLVDAIDVVAVTLLIYSLIKLVRETRSGQLIKGLVLFIAIFIISNFLQLQMINTVLSYIFQFGFIAVLIIFQPEIRKALEQLGRSNVSKSIADVVTSKDKEENKKQLRKLIVSVAEATQALQQLRMGALIVFERKTKLNEIIETGTVVNAEPTGQLIANIFFNKAPLHDGAMVIRGSKVYAAGCILPLTKNDSLSSSLGTRHRAALGISEETDAVVVVVSEETSQISVAVNGLLSRNYNRESLINILEGYLIPKSDEKSEGKLSLSFLKRKNNDEH